VLPLTLHNKSHGYTISCWERAIYFSATSPVIPTITLSPVKSSYICSTVCIFLYGSFTLELNKDNVLMNTFLWHSYCWEEIVHLLPSHILYLNVWRTRAICHLLYIPYLVLYEPSRRWTSREVDNRRILVLRRPNRPWSHPVSCLMGICAFSRSGKAIGCRLSHVADLRHVKERYDLRGSRNRTPNLSVISHP
jgi:hypothetical protein